MRAMGHSGGNKLTLLGLSAYATTVDAAREVTVYRAASLVGYHTSSSASSNGYRFW